MAVSSDKLQRELESITAEYEEHFAGQSRATREVSRINSLVQRLETLLGQIEMIPASLRSGEVTALRDSVRETLGLYQNERQAIQRAKEAGPQIEAFAEAASTANFTFALYARNFAGQNRSTRDAGLLAEMIEDLKACEKRMVSINKEKPSPDFQRDIDIVQQSLAQYQREIIEVQKAQAVGDATERANLLGALANAQFEIYGTQFAGKSRTTRRPALLQRVCDNLKRVKGEMVKLRDAHFREEFHMNNIAIVEEQLAMYEKELGEIRKARQATAMADLLGMLGGSANELFAEYREHFAGKDRGSVELARLGRICDQLGEIRRQMIELGRVEPSDSNDQNIDIVTQQLSMFESEYEAIAQVKRQAAGGGGAQEKGITG